jgi:hypothetical protein
MAKKARYIIHDALKIIKVAGDEQDAEPVDSLRGMNVLNDMMSTFEEVYGIDVGYTEISSIDDDVDTTDGSIKYITSCLAAELWMYYYNTDLPNPIIASAIRGKRGLLSLGTTPPTLQYGQTLPTGSGNYNNTSYVFYPDEDE